MTPIQWLVSPPAPPLAPARKQTRGAKLYVLRNSGEYVEQAQHKREFDATVLAVMVRIGEATCAPEIEESMPRGIFTASGRAHQSAEVVVSLRRLHALGCVWRDGNVWGVE